MKNRGSTPILTNAVGVHPRNIHTKFEANPCSGLRGEVEKLKSSRRQQRQRRRQRRRRRRTQPDRYSHTHSLSVTKKAPGVTHFNTLCHLCDGHVGGHGCLQRLLRERHLCRGQRGGER